MLRRRAFLATLLAAAAPLPVPVAAVAPQIRLVDGWVVTSRDLDAIASLDR
jgi:hypothetical protein